MRIIISPAKKMNMDTSFMPSGTVPVFAGEALMLWEQMKGMSYDNLRELWGCNEKIASLGYERLHGQGPDQGLTPAILAYEGIQYQYMSPVVFSENAWEFASEHLRILSGLYGILKPSDKVIPYRLEMQAKLALNKSKDLYEFWGSRIYEELCLENSLILNLASQEYSKVIKPYLAEGVRYITCIFGELNEGRVKVKGTLAKMARGEMVRWICEQGIAEPDRLKEFNGLSYRYSEPHSEPDTFVFLSECREEK